MKFSTIKFLGPLQESSKLYFKYHLTYRGQINVPNGAEAINIVQQSTYILMTLQAQKKPHPNYFPKS